VYVQKCSAEKDSVDCVLLMGLPILITLWNLCTWMIYKIEGRNLSLDFWLINCAKEILLLGIDTLVHQSASGSMRWQGTSLNLSCAFHLVIFLSLLLLSQQSEGLLYPYIMDLYVEQNCLIICLLLDEKHSNILMVKGCSKKSVYSQLLIPDFAKICSPTVLKTKLFFPEGMYVFIFC
jgi:hypothetical protein